MTATEPTPPTDAELDAMLEGAAQLLHATNDARELLDAARERGEPIMQVPRALLVNLLVNTETLLAYIRDDTIAEADHIVAAMEDEVYQAVRLLAAVREKAL